MMSFFQTLLLEFCCILIFLIALLIEVDSIGCFVCSSINGSEPDCEDTFNNTDRFYQPDCKAGRKGRRGKFPGTGCIKLKAETDNTGVKYSVLVRDCTVDNGDTTSDTEMGRESHCWMVNMINLDDVEMQGCALACNSDGCNAAVSRLPSYQQLGLSCLLSTLLLLLLLPRPRRLLRNFINSD